MTAEERDALEAEHAAELDTVRAILDRHLSVAVDAVRRAQGAIGTLAVDLYDVEIAEGPGAATPATLDHVLIQLAGVRATTVQAGR